MLATIKLDVYSRSVELYFYKDPCNKLCLLDNLWYDENMNINTNMAYPSSKFMQYY